MVDGIPLFYGVRHSYKDVSVVYSTLPDCVDVEGHARHILSISPSIECFICQLFLVKVFFP